MVGVCRCAGGDGSLSYGVAFELIPTGGVITGVPDDPTVFKKRIAHNILMAFGVLLFFVLAEQARSAKLYWLWMGLCAAAFVDVLMVQGRTGYVALPALVALMLFQKWRWKGLLAAVALVSTALVGAYEFSSSFHDRVVKASFEAANWKSGTPADTSIGFRLEFYQHTLDMIGQHPWIGVGTGGFKSAYSQMVSGKEMNATVNPHNLYLMIAAEFGVVGLAVLLYLLLVQWKYAGALSPPHHVTLARGLILAFAVAGLFNTLIIDHTESMFFAWGLRPSVRGLPARGMHASGC